MNLIEAKNKARKAYEELEWQPISDSPTTKYYTNWRLYEQAYESGPATMFHEPKGKGIPIGPCGNGDQRGEGYEISELRDGESLGRLVNPLESKIIAAHYSMLDKAYLLRVWGNTRLNLELCRARDGWFSLHLIIVVEPKSQVDLVVNEERTSPGTTVFELHVGEAARLNTYVVLEPSRGIAAYQLWRRRVSANAELRTGLVGFSTTMYRVEESTLLADMRARYTHRAVFIGMEGDQVDYIVDTIHVGQKTKSNSSIYGYALEKSMVVVRGLVDVRDTAEYADTEFSAEVTMLGNEARGYANPMMEIKLGRVEKATHRAAQYRIMEDQLFYLQSRGLDERAAITLMLLERSLQTVRDLGMNWLEEAIAGLIENRVRPRL